jgi:uncharacterized protein YjbI with pentapeptide repeats
MRKPTAITTISLQGDIFYKNINNTRKAYVYLKPIKRCLIQDGRLISSTSSNPKDIVTAMARILDTTSNKGLLATVVSSDGVKAFKIQHANIVKKHGIRMIKLTTSNKELHSKDSYAKNVTQIFDDNVLKSASVIIYSLSLVNNTPLCAPNCQGANLSGRDLSGANLNRANLTGANLSGANLIGANLINANLNRADLRGANLTDADLTAAYGDYVNLSNANMTRAKMESSRFFFTSRDGAVNLSGAILRDADLGRADLTYANLTSVSAEGVQAESVNLAGANLTNAILKNATLRYARFAFANLTGASLAGANVFGASFEDIRTQGSQAILTNTNFAGATRCSWAFGLRLPPGTRCDN